MSDSEPSTKKPSDPPRTVLDQVHALAEEAPRILLRDDDEGDQPGSRFVDPQAAADLKPRGHGNYEIHGEIARGGMGQIIKARDTDLGREVAIKVLDSGLADRPFVLRRFVEEAQIGGQLQHPGVVPVYEMGMMEGDVPYFAMKLVKGRTLTALLQQRKELTDDRRRHLAVFESICQTVAYAHSKGVIHRDLKPANVMIGSFGEVLVVDWGLAKVLGQGGVEDEKRAQQTNLTVIETVRSGPGSSGSDSMVGSVMGTPAYMPPEQAMGEIERLDERADVFALGAILCEILTGSPPYVEIEGGERVAVMAAHARLDPARGRLAASEADATLKELCLECLAPAPSVRPRNAGELAERVHQFLSGLEDKARAAELEATEARVRAAGERRARRLTLALASAVILALVAVGGAAYWAEEQKAERLDDARRALETNEAQVLALQQQERFGDAVTAARAGLDAVLASEIAPEPLTVRAKRTLERAEETLTEREAAEELVARNARLLARLDELRLGQVYVFRSGQYQDSERQFLEAFREYGLDLSAADLSEAVEVLRENGIAEEISFALDDWARMRRRNPELDIFEGQKLTMMALDLDQTPEHEVVRRALLEYDSDELLRLGRDPATLELRSEIIWVIIGAIFDMDRVDVSRVLCIKAASLYPDDFVLQGACGLMNRTFNRPDRAVIAFERAVAIRPSSFTAQTMLSAAYTETGNLVAALDAAKKALSLRPDAVEAQLAVAYAQWPLGYLQEARDGFARSTRLDPSNVETPTDVLGLRYLLGEVDLETFLSRVESNRTASVDATGDWLMMVTYSDDLTPAQAERALRVAREVLRVDSSNIAGLYVQAHLQMSLERYDEARATIAEYDAKAVVPQAVFDTSFDYLRAVLSKLGGDDAEARRFYGRAEERRLKLTWLRESDWDRSGLMLRRARAIEALGL